MDILAGSNISIRRDGNKVTISAAGSKGGSNIYYGTEEPAASLGVDRDLYCKLGDLPTYIVDSVDYTSLDHNALTKIAYNEFSGNISGVQISSPLYDMDREYIYLDGLIKGNTYTITVKCTLTDGVIHRYSTGDYANNYFVVTDDTENFTIQPQIILDDTFNVEQTKSGTFVAKDTNILVFAFWAMQDGHNAAITCSSIKIEGNFRKIVKIYDKVGIGWVDYVGGESYTAGSNIDITNNVISAPVMTGATADADGASGTVPQPLIADKDKVLKGDGTWGTAGADVSITPSLQSGTKVADYEINGVSGVLYSLTNTTGDYYNPIIYSTEEREVGVWIDNKPLYQKTYTAQSPFRISNSGADINNMIDNNSIIEQISNAIACNSVTLQTSNIYVGFSRGLKAFCAEDGYFDTITLWYTKTTDVAGSGSYNTLGVPTVHYSTDEQVIGTWMGETLYQKCVATGGSVPSGTTLVERTAMASTGYDTIKYTKTTDV